MQHGKFQSAVGLITCLVLLVIFMPRSALAQATTLNLSQDLVTLGIASTNMVPNQPALDAGPLFMQGVEYAKSHGIGTVIADPGAYYFLSIWNVPGSNTHVAVSGIDNMTIDFHGADLIFTHPTYYGIIVYPSVNPVLQNFTVDYLPLPFTQVRVVSVDVENAQIQYAVEPGWQNPSVFNSMQTYGPPAMEIHVYRNGQPAFGNRRMSTQLPVTGDHLAVMGTTSPPTLSAIRPGDVVVVSMRDSSDAVNTNHCTGCTLRNITVYSGGGGAAVSMFASQSNVAERIYAIPKPGTDRLVSTISGVVVGPSGPNNQIRLSRGIRTMDDAFWFFSWSVGTVQGQLGPRSLSVAPTTAWTLPAPNGSPVSFQRFSDGVILGTAVIVSQTAPAASPPFQATIDFDRDLPGNLDGAIMYTTDANLNGANSFIERSTSQSHSHNGRGIYIAGLANGTVRGNYIQNSAYAGIFLVQGMTPGDPPTPPIVNLNVANNVVDATGITYDGWWFETGAIETTTLTSLYDLMAHSVFSNINVTNNFVANAGRSAVWLGNTSGGGVTGNYLLNPNIRPDLANNYRPDIDADRLVPLVIRSSSNGVVTGNNVVDKTSGRMFVTDTQYRELAAYAPGGTMRLNAYNLGALANPAVTLTDADGNTTSLTIQNAAAHALDVKLPAAAGLGGAFVTLISGSAKYFGTLFIDSQDNIPAVNGCTYEVSMSSTSAAATAGILPILVVTQAGCSYQVLDSDSFVTPGGPATGTGVPSVGFALNSGAARTTTIEIAGQPITVTQASAVAAVSVTPSSGAGVSQKFAALYSDSNGFADIATAMLNINTSSSLANGCVVKYVRASNQLFLMNDAGTTWIGPAIPGSAGTLQNTQCTLDPQASSTSSAVNNLTVNDALIFANSFSGPKSIFMNVSNVNLSSGWQAKGIWTAGLKKTGGQLTSQ